MLLNTIILLLVVVQSTRAKDITQHSNWKLVNDPVCGSATSDRIIGGKDASLGAYPWIARIGYTYGSRPGISFQCGGSLISKQYVLTAAHCQTMRPYGSKISTIRLGEHDIDTEEDCEQGFCADPVQDVSVARVVHHSAFNIPDGSQIHDICLIRLSEQVKFTEFVRPICLPYGELLNNNYEGEFPEVAGWGYTNSHTQVTSVILQTVTLPIVGMAKCKAMFEDKAELYESQVCAGGEVGKDSCGGDSGGPLMLPKSIDGPPRYFLIGVVSYGDTYCGDSATAGIYTKVSEYLDWIMGNMRP